MSEIALDDVDLYHIDDGGFSLDDSIKLHGPPGTGKTTTAAAHLSKLMEEWGLSTGQITWLTYRRSLASDAIERLQQWEIVGDAREDDLKLLSTAHAVARRTAGGGNEVVEPWEKKRFARNHGMRFYANNPWERTAGKLFFRLDQWMEGQMADRNDHEALDRCPHYHRFKEKTNHSYQDLKADWERWKNKNDKIDYYQMLKQALRKNRVPRVAVAIIDEYHDVYPLMHAYYQQVIDQADVAVVLGDPHQVVNEFDGSDPSLFEELDLPEYRLPTTWRVPREHFSIAADILSRSHDPPELNFDHGGIIKRYRSPIFEHSSSNGWVRVPDETTPGSPQSIINNIDSDRSVMILARTRKQLDGVARALEKSGMLFESQQGLKGWGERINLYGALQKLSTTGPQPDQQQTIRSVGRMEDLNNTEMEALIDATPAKFLSKSRSTLDDRSWNGSFDRDDIDEIVNEEFWRKMTQGPASVRQLLDSTWKQGEREREREALQKALIEHDDPNPDLRRIVLCTIHGAKGREADDVLLYDGITNRVQKEMRLREAARANEHRTWYVALTRSRKRLHIMRGGFNWINPFLPNVEQILSNSESKAVA